MIGNVPSGNQIPHFLLLKIPLIADSKLHSLASRHLYRPSLAIKGFFSCMDGDAFIFFFNLVCLGHS